ncbi:MAG TPA: NADPH:quinone oxidoreductase family protein [Dermatophilaceae bacterium]|jgi:NADPH2:quinone reductase|nr:NADPH:quinone oxidoreductase family protein [Dermatophilaceae bacterium]
MRAAVISSTEGPAAVTVVDVPEPTPSAGQALVEVHRAGVTYPEVLQTRGLYQLKPPLPFVPGSEVSGIVASAPDGSGLGEGQRVAAFPGLGGFAELAAVPVPLVLPIPDDMSLDVAAALPMNYLTCQFALERRGRLERGETVLVHGAAGGIGTAATQIAKARGARVIGVVSEARKKQMALDAGADDVVPVEGFLDAVKELTGGRGVDVVVDPVGGERFTDSLRSLAPEGRLLVIGFTGGEIPTVKVNRLLLGNTSVVGVSWGGFWMPHRLDYVAGQWADLMALWETGALRPPIGATFDLADAAAAITALDERRAVGKILLRVRD